MKNQSDESLLQEVKELVDNCPVIITLDEDRGVIVDGQSSGFVFTNPTKRDLSSMYGIALEAEVLRAISDGIIEKYGLDKSFVKNVRAALIVAIP